MREAFWNGLFDVRWEEALLGPEVIRLVRRLRGRGYAERTCRDYGHAVVHFGRYLDEERESDRVRDDGGRRGLPRQSSAGVPLLPPPGGPARRTGPPGPGAPARDAARGRRRPAGHGGRAAVPPADRGVLPDLRSVALDPAAVP